MARIAIIEDVEGIRSERDVDPASPSETEPADSSEQLENGMNSDESPKQPGTSTAGRYIVKLQEVQEAFDTVNTLRYSQPTHLSGTRNSL